MQDFYWRFSSWSGGWRSGFWRCTVRALSAIAYQFALESKKAGQIQLPFFRTQLLWFEHQGQRLSSSNHYADLFLFFKKIKDYQIFPTCLFSSYYSDLSFNCYRIFWKIWLVNLVFGISQEFCCHLLLWQKSDQNIPEKVLNISVLFLVCISKRVRSDFCQRSR